MKNHEKLISQIEVIVKYFSEVAEDFGTSFYDEKEGIVTNWNADIIPTNSPDKIYFLQYDSNSFLFQHPETRHMKDSLLYRIENDKLSSLMAIQSTEFRLDCAKNPLFNTAIFEYIISENITIPMRLKNLRDIFNKHENEEHKKSCEMKELNLSLNLSIGQTNFRIHDKKMGDKIDAVLDKKFFPFPYTISDLMKKYGLGTNFVTDIGSDTFGKAYVHGSVHQKFILCGGPPGFTKTYESKWLSKKITIAEKIQYLDKKYNFFRYR